MPIIHTELEKMNIYPEQMEPIRMQDGKNVFRVFCGKESYVLKVFEKPEDRREIQNYALLKSLDILTLAVIAQTDRAILLEDAENSNRYRMGIPEDMENVETAACIGQWYRRLHDKGYQCKDKTLSSLYDESDGFTIENMEYIRCKTGTQSASAWDIYIKNYAVLRQKLEETKRTITYNDFYWTNLICSQDRSKCLMFDYHLLGQGYAYGDVRNVLSSLSQKAGEAFLEAYGAVNVQEKYLDDVIAPIVALNMACRKENFPRWAEAVLQEALTDVKIKIRRTLEES